MHLIGQIFLIALWVGMLASFIWLFAHQFSDNRKEQEKCKAEAVAQFEAWLGTAAAAQLRLGPDDCEIVEESLSRHLSQICKTGVID